MEYTKGPWKYEPESTDYIINPKDFECFKGVVHGGKLNMALCVMIADCLEAEVEANARLIAAAPEMYEALKEAENFFVVAKAYIPPHGNTLRLVQQAIAKAEGQ